VDLIYQLYVRKRFAERRLIFQPLPHKTSPLNNFHCQALSPEATNIREDSGIPTTYVCCSKWPNIFNGNLPWTCQSGL